MNDTNSDHRQIDRLFREVAERGLSRRQLIERAAVLGISPFALTVAFIRVSQAAVTQGADNPLNVDPAAPLDVVVFKGGFGDDYAINVRDNLYQAHFPDSSITYVGTQRLQEQFQARVVDGNPPDVMNNAGAGSFNSTSLVNDGQLMSLDDLMAAPAYGQEGVTLAESLASGSQADGNFDGKQMVAKYNLGMNGIWYSQTLFDEKGWTYPQTWDEMLALCQTIKDDGEYSPWTYQGLYPGYIRAVTDSLIAKTGGWDAVLKMDNLEPDAWTQPVVKQALDATAALYTNGYILEGTEGLSHTESQAFWIQGEAVFIPCGVWLENEMKDVLADYPDFNMVVQPTPALTASEAMPLAAVPASAGSDWIVFSNAKNPQGGKEFIRLLFSQEAGRFFSEATGSLTVVSGAAEGLDLGSAFASVQTALNNAGTDTFSFKWGGWYTDLTEAADVAYNELMTGQKSSDQVIAELQAVTDRLRADPAIVKLTRTAPGATPAGSPVASPAASPAG